MKKVIFLLVLFSSFGLNAACHKYNYELVVFPGTFIDDNYRFSISYCVNNEETLNSVSYTDLDYIDYNSHLNETDASFIRTFTVSSKTAYVGGYKTAVLTLLWEYDLYRDMLLKGTVINGEVTFAINTRGDPVHASTAKQSPDKVIYAELSLLEKAY